MPSIIVSFGYTGTLSTKTGVIFSFLTLLFRFLFGNVIFIDRTIRASPETIMKNVLQEPGMPKNGITKINIPRKNVLFRFIIGVLYPYAKLISTQSPARKNRLIGDCLCACQDLNLGPHEYQSSALPTELHAHIYLPTGHKYFSGEKFCDPDSRRHAPSLKLGPAPASATRAYLFKINYHTIAKKSLFNNRKGWST